MGGSTERRVRVPDKVASTLMFECRRICALCFGLEDDRTPQGAGQIAHIDGRPSNSVPDNLAWLCLRHHADYDSTSIQSRGIMPFELRLHKERLLAHIGSTEAVVGAGTDDAPPSGSSIAVYEKQIKVYRAARQLISAAIRNATVSLEDLSAFHAATDEAIFLFDPEIERYLRELYTHAVGLRLTHTLLEDLTSKDRHETSMKNAEDLLWFTKQLDEVRSLFARQLRLASRS